VTHSRPSGLVEASLYFTRATSERSASGSLAVTTGSLSLLHPGIIRREFMGRRPRYVCGETANTEIARENLPPGALPYVLFIVSWLSRNFVTRPFNRRRDCVDRYLLRVSY